MRNKAKIPFLAIGWTMSVCAITLVSFSVPSIAGAVIKALTAAGIESAVIDRVAFRKQHKKVGELEKTVARISAERNGIEGALQDAIQKLAVAQVLNGSLKRDAKSSRIERQKAKKRVSKSSARISHRLARSAVRNTT